LLREAPIFISLNGEAEAEEDDDDCCCCDNAPLTERTKGPVVVSVFTFLKGDIDSG
jgi:hypothetical protein